MKKNSAYRTLNTTTKYILQGRCKLKNLCLLITTMWDIAASCIAPPWQGSWRREGRWSDFRSSWCHVGKPNICTCFPRPLVQILGYRERAFLNPFCLSFHICTRKIHVRRQTNLSGYIFLIFYYHLEIKILYSKKRIKVPS